MPRRSLTLELARQGVKVSIVDLDGAATQALVRPWPAERLQLRLSPRLQLHSPNCAVDPAFLSPSWLGTRHQPGRG